MMKLIFILMVSFVATWQIALAGLGPIPNQEISAKDIRCPKEERAKVLARLNKSNEKEPTGQESDAETVR